MSWDRRSRLVTVRTSGNEVWKAPGLGRAPKVECITVGAEGGTWDVGHGCNTCRRISGRILIFRSIKRIWWALVAPKTHTHTPTQLCPRTPPPAYGPHAHLDQRNGMLKPRKQSCWVFRAEASETHEPKFKSRQLRFPVHELGEG